MTIIGDRTRGLALSLLVALALSACGGGAGSPPSSASTATEPATPPPVVSPPGTPPPVTPAPVTPPPVTPPPVAPPTTPPAIPSNRAPTISGSPVKLGQTERPYAFQPTAADADGDRLTFSIAGKPQWADFDVHTGGLSGTPPAGSAGTYAGIAISVSDGRLKTTLAPFAIVVGAAPTRTVTLNWTAPTTNEDGSALTDLAGYVVSYGPTSRAYTTSLDIDGAGTTSVVIEGFEPGTWFFAMQTVNVPGVRSDYTGEVVGVL